MLIEFSVENWMSFKDQAIFSMVANNELDKQKSCLSRFPLYNLGVFPTSVMYGANGAGKTALIKAVSFVQDFVLGEFGQSEHLPVVPHCFSMGPSKLSLTFLTELHNCYSYSISASKDCIHEEVLSFVHKDGKMEILFKQSYSKNKSHVGFRSHLSSKVSFGDHVLNWFKNNLFILGPRQESVIFKEGEEHICRSISYFLNSLGFGVHGIVTQENEENKDFDINKLCSRMNPGDLKIVNHNTTNDLYLVDSIHKKIKRFFAVYPNQEEDAFIPIRNGGINHLVLLLPFFIGHLNNRRFCTFIVDGLGSVLHHNITSILLDIFLKHGSQESLNNQLIFTTHDTI